MLCRLGSGAEEEVRGWSGAVGGGVPFGHAVAVVRFACFAGRSEVVEGDVAVAADVFVEAPLPAC